MEGVYGHRPFSDALRIARAVATNQLARVLPAAYVRLTGETGRGREQVSPRETALYFLDCVHEYTDVLGVSRPDAARFWLDRRIVEYGPGDIPGVALLLAGLGARSVLCVDRFPLVRFSDYQTAVVRELAVLLPDDVCRDRFWSCFLHSGEPADGLARGRVQYRVSESGLVGRGVEADVVLSRAVLEHVNDLPATCRDIAGLMADDGVSVHKVDLKSHGLHRRNPLDFLTWPEGLWQAMFSHKGAPNRLRVDSYRAAAAKAGLATVRLEPCELAQPSDIDEVRPHLAAPFRAIGDADLAWLSFWIVLRHPAAAQAQGAAS